MHLVGYLYEDLYSDFRNQNTGSLPSNLHATTNVLQVRLRLVVNIFLNRGTERVKFIFRQFLP
jgi:hypothetical protein